MKILIAGLLSFTLFADLAFATNNTNKITSYHTIAADLETALEEGLDCFDGDLLGKVYSHEKFCRSTFRTLRAVNKFKQFKEDKIYIRSMFGHRTYNEMLIRILDTYIANGWTIK